MLFQNDQCYSRYIDVDPEVISKSLMWLVAKQRPDGSFKEEGAISHPLQVRAEIKPGKKYHNFFN